LDSDLHDNVVDVRLQINIDGLPLFNSSSKQFWSILGRVCSPCETDPFVISIFCGEKKPQNVDRYLEDFITDMRVLEQGPVDILGISVQVKIACFICDTPTRAFVRQLKGHSGYYGCDKCMQKGEWDGKLIFPEVNCPTLTDVQFDEMTVDATKHKTGISPLSRLSLGMVSQFPLDFMHLVCLGVMRRLLKYWTSSPRTAKGCRLRPINISNISNKLLQFSPLTPREFARKCRPLNYLDNWKATEFRQFLLFSGMVALKDQVSCAQYNHFLLLFVAIFCLVSSDFCFILNDYAHGLLCKFVHDAARLY
jgi:hypothetical protein